MDDCGINQHRVQKQWGNMSNRMKPQNRMMRSILIYGQRHVLAERQYDNLDPVLKRLRRMTPENTEAIRNSESTERNYL